MAFIFTFTPDQPMSRQFYNAALARLAEAGAAEPPGRLYHVCYGSEDDLRVTDVWESRESFEHFGDTLMPILRELGVDVGAPQISEVRNIIPGRAQAGGPSGNVTSHREAHDAFNRRDLDAAVRLSRDDCVYVDHGRGLTFKGPEQFREFLQGWVDALSNATVADAHYIGGDTSSVATFHGRGTNDGPMGPYPATGHRLDLPFCEILHYDGEGRIASGELFYDSMTMLVQLGHMTPPERG